MVHRRRGTEGFDESFQGMGFGRMSGRGMFGLILGFGSWALGRGRPEKEGIGVGRECEGEIGTDCEAPVDLHLGNRRALGLMVLGCEANV